MAAPTGVKYGTDNYVEYIVGGVNSRIVISATHGGNMRPEGMPSRNANPSRMSLGEGAEVRINADVYTMEMAIMLKDEIQKLTSVDQTPHLIICKYLMTSDKFIVFMPKRLGPEINQENMRGVNFSF